MNALRAPRPRVTGDDGRRMKVRRYLSCAVWAAAALLAGPSGGADCRNDCRTTLAQGPVAPAAPAGAGSGPRIVPLIVDKRIIGIPSPGAYPAKGAPVVDPVTGFNVVRAADKSELVAGSGPSTSALSIVAYSRYSPANTTGEYYLVHGNNSTSAWVYRTATHAPVGPIRFNPSLGANSRLVGEVNELRWDYSGQYPNRLYFVGRSLPTSQSVRGENPEMSFYSIDLDPVTGRPSSPVLIRDFSSLFPAFPGVLMNDVEGDSSNDSRYWAWMINGNTAASGYKPYAIIVYDKQTNTVLSTLQRNCLGSAIPCKEVNSASQKPPFITRPNMVEMSPLGTRVIVHWERVNAGYDRDAEMNGLLDGPKAFLKDFSDPIRIGADATHSGWAWGPNGEEMFVSQNNRNDWIEAVNIASAATANCKVIAGNSYGCGVKLISQTGLDGGSWSIGYHFGKIYDPAKRGWMYMNTYDKTGYTFWGKNQNLLVQIPAAGAGASARVVRLGSTYNQYHDYRSEGSGAMDFKGENIWTTGNWGFIDGRGDVFRIQLPADWYSALPR